LVEPAPAVDQRLLEPLLDGLAVSGIPRHERDLAVGPAQQLVDRLRPGVPSAARGQDLAALEDDLRTAAGGGERADAREPAEMAHLEEARDADHLEPSLHRGASPGLGPEVGVALHHDLDADEQLADGRVLGEVLVGPGFEAAVAVLVVVPARQEDDRRVADEAVAAGGAAETGGVPP